MRLQDINFYLKNKTGLEIGGPSRLLALLYEGLDFITFFNHKEAMSVHASSGYPCNTKNTLFGDATEHDDFKQLGNEKFDVVISSHTLEHIANPIKALKIWNSVLVEYGLIVTIVPEKNCCWDRSREYTSLDHLIDDFNNNITEQDMTHVHEASCMQETRPEYYRDVGSCNSSRVIHHHTFCKDTLIGIHKLAGFEEVFCGNMEDDNLQLVYIGRR